MTGPTGAAPTGATGAGATGATGPAPTGGTGIQDPRLRAITIPEKYAKEPWAKDIKSMDDFWSKMAGAQKLLGKDKVALPGDGATQDELAAFYKRMGRPDNPEGYEFKSVEALKEVERNVDLDHGMKKILFEEGVSKAAGERIIAKSEALLYGMQKPMIDAAATRNMEFQKLANEVLGEDKVAAMEAFKTTMRESLGDKAHLASKLDNMSNDELMTLIVLGKNLHDKYSGESRLPARPGSPANLSGNLKTDFQTLSAQKLAIKTDEKIPEHIKKMKIANLNLQMQKIGTKAKDQNIDLFAQ